MDIKPINSLILILPLLICTKAFSQNIDIYYHAPANDIQRIFTGESATYINADSCFNWSTSLNVATGYSYVLLDSKTNIPFRLLGSPHLITTYDSIVNDKSSLRKRIKQLSNLSNGLVNDIDIYIFDDRAGLPASQTCACTDMFGNLTGVWPCAYNDKDKDGKYRGYMYLGELAADLFITHGDGGYWAWNTTIIHEFSHTQFANEYNAAGRPVSNKLGIRGTSLAYGEDGTHWGSEIMGSEQSALDEGLATFWGLESNKAERDALIDWVNYGNSKFRLGTHTVLSGTSEMWNAPHVVAFSGTIPANRIVKAIDRTQIPVDTITVSITTENLKPGAGYELRLYKWLDVPGDYIFYNEQMFTAFTLLFHEFAYDKVDTSFNKIYQAARAMTPPRERLRYPGLLANHLASTMEQYANTAKGKAEEAKGTLTSSMFVYALYDIITHFGISESDFKRELSVHMETYVPVPKPKAFTAYWAHREKVKEIVCPFLGGNKCLPGVGAIDIVKAVEAARDYFRLPARILR